MQRITYPQAWRCYRELCQVQGLPCSLSSIRASQGWKNLRQATVMATYERPKRPGSQGGSFIYVSNVHTFYFATMSKNQANQGGKTRIRATGTGACSIMFRVHFAFKSKFAQARGGSIYCGLRSRRRTNVLHVRAAGREVSLMCVNYVQIPLQKPGKPGVKGFSPCDGHGWQSRTEDSSLRLSLCLSVCFSL